jgi:hypothetical protein
MSSTPFPYINLAAFEIVRRTSVMKIQRAWQIVLPGCTLHSAHVCNLLLITRVKFSSLILVLFIL